jgi:hypothetical protein
MHILLIVYLLLQNKLIFITGYCSILLGEAT